MYIYYKTYKTTNSKDLTVLRRQRRLTGMAKQQQQQHECEQVPLPLHYESATTLADKIRRREVTSLELVELF
jgi:allophanate hydrolase subunit 1